MNRLMEALCVKTDSELARALGITPPSVASARAKSQVPIGWIEKASIISKANMDWLYFGRGPMRPGEAISPEKWDTAPQDTETIWIPMVEAVLSAGHGSFETSAHSERKYAFRLDFITRKGNPKNMVLMRVAGDSMSPEILDSDVVLIDQSKRDIMPGKIFAVGFEESIYLKRIDNLPGKVILKSVNPAYPPVELDVRDQMDEQFRIIGRVLWSCREYF